MANLIKLKIAFYKSDIGNEPVRDWIKSLDKQDKKIIGEDIKTVQYGWPLGMPLVRKLDRNLWEIRINLGDRIVRVIFTVMGDVMILLHAFIKKSRKTPKIDLDLAKRRKQVFER